MTTKCFRCGGVVPEPDIKEAIAREMDWRDFVEEHKVTEEDDRVLICIPCADELQADTEVNDLELKDD